MKKLAILLTFLLIFSLTGCTTIHKEEDLNALRDAFLQRGDQVVGYEVDEIETYDGLSYFAVRVCLNTDDATSVDDYFWFEANVTLYPTQQDADEAYRVNRETGLGGNCVQDKNILMYWLNNDPFEDLYKEVFYSVFTPNKEG